jgi:hypothetical protein
MGRIQASVAVSNPADPERTIGCDALVDTGAFCLTLPAAWKDCLGPLPLSRRVEVETADHRVVAAEVAGPVVIRIDGFDPLAGEVLFLDIGAGRWTHRAAARLRHARAGRLGGRHGRPPAGPTG